MATRKDAAVTTRSRLPVPLATEIAGPAHVANPGHSRIVVSSLAWRKPAAA